MSPRESFLSVLPLTFWTFRYVSAEAVRYVAFQHATYSLNLIPFIQSHWHCPKLESSTAHDTHELHDNHEYTTTHGPGCQPSGDCYRYQLPIRTIARSCKGFTTNKYYA